ncbi:unnamed protein product, partial [Arabidopsis halleri]
RTVLVLSSSLKHTKKNQTIARIKNHSQNCLMIKILCLRLSSFNRNTGILQRELLGIDFQEPDLVWDSSFNDNIWEQAAIQNSFDPWNLIPRPA